MTDWKLLKSGSWDYDVDDNTIIRLFKLEEYWMMNCSIHPDKGKSIEIFQHFKLGKHELIKEEEAKLLAMYFLKDMLYWKGYEKAMQQVHIMTLYERLPEYD